MHLGVDSFNLLRCTRVRFSTWQTFNKPRFLIHSKISQSLSPRSSSTTDSHAPKVPEPSYAWHEAVEDIDRYRPGGYHPVHIGDKFSAGRYEVTYKLGYGTYSTVWLCKDLKNRCYVAIKVGVSDTRGVQRRIECEREIFHTLRNVNPTHPGKRFVVPLLDEFALEGPNGHHQCFVFPVALNSVAVAKEASVSDNSRFPAHVGRSIATQLLLALSYIHSCGIVHAGNLVLSIQMYASVHRH